MSSSIRKASVKGSFYPDSCSQVEKMFGAFNREFAKQKIPKSIISIKPKALLVPHAGYVYSGFTANFAYRFLQHSKPKRIVVIGPSHHHYFKGISGSFYESFETPCGEIEIDTPYLIALAKRFNISFEEKAHAKEHSTEVQMPFVWHYFPDTPVIELIYGEVSTYDLANLMVALLSSPDNLVIVSSDLSHFYTLEEAKKLDNICLSSVAKLDRKQLNRGCEACGFRGIESIIVASIELKLKSKLLDYKTSADAYGDKKRVVGYLSAMFY